MLYRYIIMISDLGIFIFKTFNLTLFGTLLSNFKHHFWLCLYNNDNVLMQCNGMENFQFLEGL